MAVPFRISGRSEPRRVVPCYPYPYSYPDFLALCALSVAVSLASLPAPPRQKVVAGSNRNGDNGISGTLRCCSVVDAITVRRNMLLRTKIEDTIQNDRDSEIESRLPRLDNILEKFEIIQNDIEILSGNQIQDDERQMLEDTYYEVLSLAKSLLNANRNVSVTPSQPLDRISNLSTNCGYTGDSLSNVQRFYYLQACLKGEAAQVIGSIEMSNNNYEIAWIDKSNNGSSKIMQRLWQTQTSWDEVIPLELHSLRKQFHKSMENLNDMKILRKVLTSGAVDFELHAFGDTSESALGSCVYIRSVTRLVDKANPAGIVSRGRNPLKLMENEMWWYGPEFLREDFSYWPEQQRFTNSEILEKRLDVGKAGNRNKGRKRTPKAHVEPLSWMSTYHPPPVG
ncbi:hypothetical protein Trydic_g21870 [Trypoxylus dichotomus]